MENLERKILVTGAKGFIGQNLIANLRQMKYQNIYEYDSECSVVDLKKFTADCSFVFHLAGVNRPKDTSEFMQNCSFTDELLELLKENKNKCPIIFTSSISAAIDSDYGKSKLAAEKSIQAYAKKNNVQTLIYRLPNVFGKWCRPNYNSAVATFCYNIARNLPIKVNDASAPLSLVYIDDVVSEFISAMEGKAHKNDGLQEIPTVYNTTVGEVAKIIESFPAVREKLEVVNMQHGLTSKLYSTYLSYLPTDKFNYPLKMHEDLRGSFTEIIKGASFGQISVNLLKKEITKGNHWHNTKNEKFIIISGKALIRLRRISDTQIIEYEASGEKLEVIDIPPGYCHNITNIGNGDLILLIWANEFFDTARQDTMYEDVISEKK